MRFAFNSETLLFVLAILLVGVPSYGKQQPAESNDLRLKSHISVAIIPYVNEPSSDTARIIKSVEKNLQEQKGIRVLDRKAADEILSYYLNHVDKNSRDEEIKSIFREAREEYQKASYEKSFDLLKAAESRIREGIGKGGTNALLEDVLILKAKLEYVLGRKGNVNSIYEEIIRLDPALEFPKGLYSKWEHDALKQAKAKIEPTRTGYVEIYSDPKNSEVYLNGLHVGVTYYDKPFILDKVPTSQHCIDIKTIHYENYTECFVLKENERRTIKAVLKRISVPNGVKTSVVSPARFGTAYELSGLVSSLGYYMGVDKIILIHGFNPEKPDAVVYQIGDVSLGAVSNKSEIVLKNKNGTDLALMTKEMRSEIKKDVLSNPGDELISQSVGSIQLHEQRRKPIYKRPIFWILTGAGAAAGGITAVILGAGAAAAITGGVIIGL